MLKVGTETGSLMNHLMSRVAEVTPIVGMGATILYWSDRKAGTIIEVSEKHFVLQLDNAERSDKNGMSDSQQYTYTPDPNGAKYTFKRVARGKLKGQWRVDGLKSGNALLLGSREQYYDFSF